MSELSASEPKKIVIIGGGVIGCSTAYFLTRHRYYDPKIHSIVILEASRIAGGASGKAGGFIADWATPKCLAPLSFNLHTKLAKYHGGDKVWGHRRVFAAEIRLEGRDLDQKTTSPLCANANTTLETSSYPSALDWLLPGSIKDYKEIGTPYDSGQVNPFMFTTTLAKLAEERGAKIIIGSAIAINYKDSKESIQSVTYTQGGTLNVLEATDILVAAGPWTPRILPSVRLMTPRGHSVIARPSRDLSPYILFPNIKPAQNSTFKKLLSPDIYPRPGDEAHGFHTVYGSGPDDFEVPLPSSTDSVELDEQKCDDVWVAMKSVSQEIHDGEVITKQACYKPQIRKHREDEEVGPIVGSTGIKGLWLATGHDEWGIQNAPGTGLVMSEMIFEGAAQSADCESLDPKHFLKTAPSL